MKQSVVTFKHQIKLANSLSKILNNKLKVNTIPVKEESKISTSHRIALIKASKK